MDAYFGVVTSGVNDNNLFGSLKQMSNTLRHTLRGALELAMR